MINYGPDDTIGKAGVERLCEGHGRAGDLEKLETLADYVSRGSLCGLGQTAPNPVATTLRYFREEYEAHLHDRRCPAGRPRQDRRRWGRPSS